MVAGGFAVAGSRIAEIEAHISKLRTDAGMTSEFHWSGYRGGHRKGKAYRALVDYAFDLLKAHHAALHVIIARFQGYNHKKNNGENKDTSVNRMYYQLLLHRVAKFYGHSCAIHVRLDAGNDCEDICSMRNQVCADAYQRFRTNKTCKPNCIRSIIPMDSRSSGIIQMADVIIGGIAAKRNGLQHSSEKGPLADYILATSGIQDWGQNTPMDARKLTIWNHQSRGGGTP